MLLACNGSPLNAKTDLGQIVTVFAIKAKATKPKEAGIYRQEKTVMTVKDDDNMFVILST